MLLPRTHELSLVAFFNRLSNEAAATLYWEIDLIQPRTIWRCVKTLGRRALQKQHHSNENLRSLHAPFAFAFLYIMVLLDLFPELSLPGVPEDMEGLVKQYST